LLAVTAASLLVRAALPKRCRQSRSRAPAHVALSRGDDVDNVGAATGEEQCEYRSEPRTLSSHAELSAAARHPGVWKTPKSFIDQERCTETA
jgi:hypothetical protein